MWGPLASIDSHSWPALPHQENWWQKSSPISIYLSEIICQSCCVGSTTLLWILRLCDTHSLSWFSMFPELVIFASSTPSAETAWWILCISISLATETSEPAALHLLAAPDLSSWTPEAECVLQLNGWAPHISRCEGIDSVRRYPSMRSNFIPEFSWLMRLKSKLSAPNSVPLAFYSKRCNVHRNSWIIGDSSSFKHYANFPSLANEGSARAHCTLQGLLDSHRPTSGWEASARVDFQRPDKSPW